MLAPTAQVRSKMEIMWVEAGDRLQFRPVLDRQPPAPPFDGAGLAQLLEGPVGMDRGQAESVGHELLRQRQCAAVAMGQAGGLGGA